MKTMLQPHRCAALTAAILLALTAAPGYAASKAPDLDGDGIPNLVDPDVDADGIPNALDDNIDGGYARSGPYRGQYLGDHLTNDNPAEKDLDGDTLSDASLAERDIDGDGKADDAATELDIDGDGRADDAASERDIDSDGRNDDSLTEDDIDGDGYDDDDPGEDDTDGDGRHNDDADESDHDGDGHDDADDDDDDGDGHADDDDDDDDNDGVEDNDDQDHHDGPGELEYTAQLVRTAAAPANATARAQISIRASGRVKFEIELDRVIPGTYQVFVGDVPRGSIIVRSGDNDGEIEFESAPDDPGELLLDFNPAGMSITVRLSGKDVFTGNAPIPGPVVEPQTYESNFDPAPAAPENAEGTMTLKIAATGAVTLKLEIKNLPAGSYAVKVAGVERGTLIMKSDDDETKGDLKFTTNPNEVDEAMLDFEPAFQAVSIEKDGTVYLSGTSSGPPPAP